MEHDHLRPTPLLIKTRASDTRTGFEDTELRYFRSCLKWVCIDQSNRWRAALSWAVFLLLAVVVPILSHVLYTCGDCDEKHQRSYDAVVQVSLSVFATLSFLCLSSWFRRYGLGRFLFLDKLSDVSDNVRSGYVVQFKRSIKILCSFVVPIFTADAAYKIWWFITGSSEITYYGNMYASDIIACTLMLSSWLYRTSIFFLVCVLYRLISHLQLLRMDDYAQVFHREMEVASILKEHLGIRRTLRVISHRFRAFILSTLVLVTATQLAALLSTLRATSDVNLYKAGELALSSISLVSGLFICLRSSTKITHKAQSITALASKWHVCCTIDSFDVADGETPHPHLVDQRGISAHFDSDEEEEEKDGEDALDNTKMMPVFAHTTISFQKRQAFVTYLENNKAGITVYGFMLDRTWLQTIFCIQLTLLLWLLNKIIGFS
uniref:Gustatory receptor n=1 Tax=Kalanchoe fedtschenkoi TaxID=63787 RepID=A0A7N0TTZ0_KALFE